MELSSRYQERWSRFCNSFGYILETYLPYHNTCLKAMEGELSAMPNILIYGMYGFPLDLLWKQSLLKRFNVERFSPVSCTWGKELQYTETPYYIHIDLENPSVPKDVQLLQEFLKTIITTHSIVRDRHVIILENIDILACKNTNMNAFRVLLERFSKNVWFICTTYHISRIEQPIRSRFHSIRIPLPNEGTISDIVMYLDRTTQRQTFQIRNLILAIAMPNYEDNNLRWIASTPFPPVCDYILYTKTPTIEGVRAIIYKAFQCGVRISGLAISIIDACIYRGDTETNIHMITSEFARYEHMSSQSKGTRTLLYMEHMLHFVMLVLPEKRKIQIE